MEQPVDSSGSGSGPFAGHGHYACDTCEEEIESHEAFFACEACNVQRCVRCAVSVVVNHDYDRVDPGHPHKAERPGHGDHEQDGTTARRGAGGGAPRYRVDDRARAIAQAVAARAQRIANEVGEEQKDVLDHLWERPEGNALLQQFFNVKDPRGLAEAIEVLVGGLQQLLEQQPPLVEAQVPAKIFGDIHGQIRDMLLLFYHYDFPQAYGPVYIFNGDWVDRGGHQLEVVCLVFALKLAFPTQVWLVRGNHEDGSQNRHMKDRGFYHECCTRLPGAGEHVFSVFERAFDWLPLGCVLDRSVLVVHGGIGSGAWDLEYLRKLRRPLEHKRLHEDPALYNVLWSDPMPDTSELGNSFGCHDSPRDHCSGLVVTFGPDVTESFCRRNNLEMIVRSHQAKSRGNGYEVLHQGRCVRVFSARDYEGHGNDGACLSLTRWGAGSGTVVVLRPQVLRALTHSKGD